MQQSKQQLQPPTSRVAEGPLEKQGMSASLTNQLHQAAVSVMKWKMQLENEIKQRDGKISELQETIKNIKSSLLNEQQISESLSGKLQNEMFIRADVSSRITKTRDICISLEKHCSYLSTAMKKCCEEMATVKAAQFEYVSELEKLIEKSENCDQIISDLTKERDELMEIYLEEKEEREKITEDSITLKSLIDQKMEEAKVAVAREAEKAVKVEANLTLIEEKYQTLTSLNEHLRQQLTLNEQMHLEKECTLDADISLFKNLLEDNKCALLEERAKLTDFEIKAVTLQAEMAKLEEEQSAAVEKDKTNEVKIRELALKLDEISQGLTKETGELSKLKAEKDSLEVKLLVIAELETELTPGVERVEEGAEGVPLNFFGVEERNGKKLIVGRNNGHFSHNVLRHQKNLKGRLLLPPLLSLPR